MDKVNEEALKQLEEYKKGGCHMMIPTMQSLAALADGFRLITSPVQIINHPREGDVYPHESAQYDGTKKEWKSLPVTGDELVRFHAQGFQKLAIGANILWSQPKLKIDPKFPRVLCEISGAVRNVDGTWRSLPDYAGSDLDIIKEGIIAQYSFNGKFDSAKQWLVDRDFLQKKKFQQQAAITTAKNRVTARLLGLKNTYSVAELTKPFVFVQIVFVPDMKDEYTRRLVIKSNVLQIAMANVFGQPAARIEEEPQALEYLGEIPVDKCRQDDVIDIIPTEPPKTYTLDPSEDVPFSLGSEPAANSPESLRADFENSDTEGQAKALTVLAGKKGYALQKWLGAFKPPKTLQTLSPGKRVEIYDHLCGMADVEKEGRAA